MVLHDTSIPETMENIASMLANILLDLPISCLINNTFILCSIDSECVWHCAVCIADSALLTSGWSSLIAALILSENPFS